MAKLSRNEIIHAKKIFKSFKLGNRSTSVLKDVSLVVPNGEFLVIFGPSGCGKSTLLHVVMGLERPDSGNLKFKGIDLWELNSLDRANVRKKEVGIMYQQQHWIRSLSVVDNISFSGQLIGMEKEEARKKTLEILSEVGMLDRAYYVPSELSAGEQQKIGLARALMSDPSVIIADEPTGNLDLKSGYEMMEMFSKLKKSGKTIIMVTHNPEYVKYADRALIMIDGKIKNELDVSKINVSNFQKKIAEEFELSVKEKSDTKNVSKMPTIKDSKEEEEKQTLLAKISYIIRFNIRFIIHTLIFFLLAVIHIFAKNISSLNNFENKVTEKLKGFVRKIDGNLRGKISNSINSMDLAEISLKNLLFKRSRTIITIVGMSIGIGFIVFLLSLGYGLERLVVNEVTRLGNMKQVDVIPNSGSNLVLDEEGIESLKKIPGVSKIMPIISVASRVEQEKYSTDIVLYGVDEDYIKSSADQFIIGDVFNKNKKEAVINQEFITTIGKSGNDFVGEKLRVSIISEDENRSEDYTVVGVINDNNPSIVYVPISNLQNTEGNEYSQATLIVENEKEIQYVRSRVEALGFESISIMDTVSEIENIFKFTKIGLVFVGGIALSIAILGMFNTLTVSLLERTREVGLMKTIGMNADEIRSLFLNESMLIGFSGGVLGVFFGIVLGVILSLTVSLVAYSKGGVYVPLNFLPVTVVIGMIVLSIIVGFITGLYPSSRAVKMAPLDALRYE